MQDLYARLVELTGDGIYRYTVERGILLFANQGLVRILDLDCRAEELLGRNLRDILLYTEKEGSLRQTIIDLGEIRGFEYHFRTLKGEDRWVIHDSCLVRDPDTGQQVIEAIVKDITARKRAEQALEVERERLRSAVSEKESLLKEMHHRVKNNLQIVSSLLRLQSEYIRDVEALDMVKDCVSRIRTIALIHERLYKSHNLARVDFAEYVRHLAGQMFAACGARSDRVRFAVDIPADLSLGVHAAIPCALIISELITNALKHAFEDGEGTIRVSLRGGDSQPFELAVADDGAGLPDELDLKHPKSLGLELVHTLTGQIGGEISVIRSPGTEFRIRFPAA